MIGMPNRAETRSPGAEFSFEGEIVSERVFLSTLGEVISILEELCVPYGLLGGVASATLGRPRWTHDADVLVRPEDARRVLEALAAHGFATQETNPHWLYKAKKRGVLVDVLFKAKGDIYLDDEMISRVVVREFKGVPIRCIPVEDLIVIKSVVHDEETPRHWHDALALLASGSIDWDYLVRRAQFGPRRVLSLLVYAQSNDLLVPDSAIHKLWEMVYG